MLPNNYQSPTRPASPSQPQPTRPSSSASPSQPQPTRPGPARATLDANICAPMTKAALTAWVQAAANPVSPLAARFAADSLARELSYECGFEFSRDPTFEEGKYSVSWFSSTAEANCAIITGAVRRYTRATNRVPHLITSAGEPPCILACCRALAGERACEHCVLPIGRSGAGLGAVSPSDLKRSIRKNTCLVVLSAASIDTGIMNDLRALLAITRSQNVPFHSDVSQLFGRLDFISGLDSWTASFAPIGGPPGLAVLTARHSFISGYSLNPYLGGEASALGELRATSAGDPESYTLLAPAIAAASVAWATATEQKKTWSGAMRALRDEFWSLLATKMPALLLDDCPQDPAPSIDGRAPMGAPLHHGSSAGRAASAGADAGRGPALFWIAPAAASAAASQILPNTLLLAVRNPGFDAEVARIVLARHNITVGRVNSGTVYALNLPAALRKGILRISFPPSFNDVPYVVDTLYSVIMEMHQVSSELNQNAKSPSRNSPSGRSPSTGRSPSGRSPSTGRSSRISEHKK